MNQIQRWKTFINIFNFKHLDVIFSGSIKQCTERWNEWSKHNWLDTSMLHFHSSDIFIQKMCGTAFTQGCMLGHAKDEFQDDFSSVSTFLALAQRGQFWTAWRGNVLSFRSFDWGGKRGLLTACKLEFDMITGLVLLAWLKEKSCSWKWFKLTN